MARVGMIAGLAGALGACLVSGGAMAGTALTQAYTFTLTGGGTFSFTLPVKTTPVQISGSLEAVGGGTQTPSAMISALVAENATTSQVTWVAINGDGTTMAGNTISGGPVVKFAFSNAVLTATVVAGGLAKMTVTQSTGAVSSIKYRITLVY